MLVVSRRADESILIKLADGADGTRTLNDVFANGPIEITLLGGNGKRVRMGIAAPPELSIRRKDRDGSAAE
jgi:sRNA-binding carbon storage regulator CsrA